jgi:anti-sigma factor RsiW
MTTHEQIQDRLSDYLDDELDPAARDGVHAHLRTCVECRAVLEQLRAVAARAARLTDEAPAVDPWPGVAGRIGSSRRAIAFNRPHRTFSFTMPQLVAAGLALMVLSGGTVWLARLGGDRTDFPRVGAQPIVQVDFADEHYDRAIADLQAALEAERANLDPRTVQVLETNLATIDRAIEQSRLALSGDPANVYLNGHLADARKRKLALLREATTIIHYP